MAKVRGGMSAINVLIIILCIIILVWVLYYIYTTWFSGKNTLTSTTVNLNSKPPPLPILVTTLTNPQSTKYAYGIWIYVNTWDTNINKVIFSRYNDILLYLDKVTGFLKCAVNSSQTPFYTSAQTTDVVMDPEMLSSTYKSTNNFVTVTNNFPLQTWVYIVVNVNNSAVDIYLNGKMVKSLQIDQVMPDKTSNIFYGNGYDAVVSGFTRWSTPVDPNMVWNTYVNGTNSNSLSGALGGGYHAAVTVTKDNATTSQFSIF
jgi:hypothetical protein